MELEKKEPLRAWYVVHTYSGYENKVKDNLESKVASQGLQNEIFDVVVPVEDETEVKDGKTKVTKRKIFPGYVLVDMIVNNRSWYVVRNTQGVTGFVGTEKEPIPLTPEEADRILHFVGSSAKKSETFAVDDSIRIKSGWFKDNVGKVTEVDAENKRIKATVNGKSIDIEFSDAEKF